MKNVKPHTYNRTLIEAIISIEARKQNKGKERNILIVSFRKLFLCTLFSFLASIGKCYIPNSSPHQNKKHLLLTIFNFLVVAVLIFFCRL